MATYTDDPHENRVVRKIRADEAEKQHQDQPKQEEPREAQDEHPE